MHHEILLDGYLMPLAWTCCGVDFFIQGCNEVLNACWFANNHENV